MRISVLIPVWQAADTVALAVQDALDQRWDALEVLAIHQGPPDRSLAALQRIRDPRLSILRTEQAGTAAALELGRTAARGEWIARLDADDRCPPERLQEQVRWADRTGAQVVPCQWAPFPEGRERYALWQNALLRHEEMARERFVEAPWMQGTAIFRREALQAVGGWHSGDFMEDYDQVLRLFAAGIRQEKLPQVCYRWRIHAAQDTLRRSLAEVRALKARHLDLPPGAYVAGTGRSLQEWALLLGRPAVSFDPRRPQNLPEGYPVLVFGSPQVRAALRRALADRPHVFVA